MTRHGITVVCEVRGICNITHWTTDVVSFDVTCSPDTNTCLGPANKEATI